MDKFTILTDADGVKYRLFDNGTVKRLDGEKSDFARSGRQRPLLKEDLRDRNIGASEDVPEKLRQEFDEKFALVSAELRTIRRDQEMPDEPLLPNRPAWVDATFQPRRAIRAARRRVSHRDVALDPLVVWGGEDRKTYFDTSYPWGCICRVIASDGTPGSGIIVGPRHVLTASHVINWADVSTTVEVHRAGRFVAATAQAIRVWAFEKVGEPDYTTVDDDYALIVTNARLGDRFGWMGCRTYDSGWDGEDYWFNIGYPGSFGGLTPTWQNQQNLDEDEWDYGEGRAMTTSADITRGNSGGPMFAFWDDGPYVVAVVSAEGVIFASGTENWCAGGSNLTRLVNFARSADP